MEILMLFLLKILPWKNNIVFLSSHFKVSMYNTPAGDPFLLSGNKKYWTVIRLYGKWTLHSEKYIKK